LSVRTGPEKGAKVVKRLESAQKRHLNAIKTLTALRGMAPRTLAHDQAIQLREAAPACTA
jgi:hypothetical protein